MKVDVNKIEGYNEMSPEDKLKALESYEFDEPDMSDYIKKTAYDKVASELSKKKKELADKLTEDEARALAEKEEKEAMKKELAELRKKQQIADNKAKYLGLGYSEELAASTAEALAEGDMEKVFSNHKLHLENYEKSITDKLIGGTARQKGGSANPSGTMTKEKLKAMTFEDRAKWATQNREEYTKLMEVRTNGRT